MKIVVLLFENPNYLPANEFLKYFSNFEIPRTLDRLTYNFLNNLTDQWNKKSLFSGVLLMGPIVVTLLITNQISNKRNSKITFL